jgi:uncharacterized membrane protein YphA (DoxX/SURF4 family)
MNCSGALPRRFARLRPWTASPSTAITVAVNYRNALGATYPVVREITGRPFFDAAVDAFTRDCPSTGGDLKCTGRFAGFLAAYPYARELPYLPDVAQLEWAIDEASRAADSAGSAEQVLAAPRPGAGRGRHPAKIRPRPFLRLVRSAFPVMRIWQVHQDEADKNARGPRCGRRSPSSCGGKATSRPSRGSRPPTSRSWTCSRRAAISALRSTPPWRSTAAFDLASSLARSIADGTNRFARLKAFRVRRDYRVANLSEPHHDVCHFARKPRRPRVRPRGSMDGPAAVARGACHPRSTSRTSSLASALTKVKDWNITIALFENEYHVPLLSPAAAAMLGTAAELGLPLLLLEGLGTRLAALALFAFNAVAVISYPDLSDAGLKDHILWGTLMLVLAVYGPGKLSADRLLSRSA